MKKLNEYKRITKGILTKMLEVKTKEVIEEVQEIVNVTEKKYFVGREVEGKMEALAYQTGYGVHWTEDLSSETVGIYTLEEITEKMKWISNSKATIQEVKQEIAPEATKEEIIAPEENNRIELYFEGIPSIDVRNHLKSKGFKWSPTKKAWQNFRSSLRLAEIKKYIEMIEIIDI